MCRVFLLHREQDFCNFCCKPSRIKFCIEVVSVGEIYNTLLDSNEGDLSPHTSQTIYFSKTNENKMSDKEAPVGEVVELESGIEPLSIIFINIRRHSVMSCWFSSQVKSNKFIAIHTHMKILSWTNMDPTNMTTRDEGSIAYWSPSY